MFQFEYEGYFFGINGQCCVFHRNGTSVGKEFRSKQRHPETIYVIGFPMKHYQVKSQIKRCVEAGIPVYSVLDK